MSEVKSTPGPWFHDGAGLIFGLPEGDSDESQFVADVARDGMHAGSVLTERELANADLTSASPDLRESTYLLAGALEALVGEGSFADRKIRVKDREWMTFSQILDIADAALGKAKGAA